MVRKERNGVPRQAVNIFLDAHPFLVGCEGLYAGQERQRIEGAELELVDLMLSCATICRGSCAHENNGWQQTPGC